jgi:hypothetical protein
MRASFPRAIAWLAHNDDCQWVYDPDWVAPVTAVLVADLFDKKVSHVRREIELFRHREGLGHAR